MQIVVAIGAKLNISPLDLLNNDIDNFILLLNYFLSKTQNKAEQNAEQNECEKSSDFWSLL